MPLKIIKSIHLGSQRTFTFLFWIAFSILVHFALTCTLFDHSSTPCVFQLEEGTCHMTLEAHFVEQMLQPSADCVSHCQSHAIPENAVIESSLDEIVEDPLLKIESVADVSSTPLEQDHLMSIEDNAAYNSPAALKKTTTNAALIKNPHPKYPIQARTLGQSGTVRLQVTVNVDGKPKCIEILESSGYPLLDDRAYDTVLKKWRFKPATINDQPIESKLTIAIEFTLENNLP